MLVVGVWRISPVAAHWHPLFFGATSMQQLPVQYHLEVYEGSFVNDPSYTVQTSSSLPNIAVGNYFNHRTHDGWNRRPNTETEAFRVKEVEHIVWSIENSHVGHKLMVLLEVVPRKW
jgi:hypothetical protein